MELAPPSFDPAVDSLEDFLRSLLRRHSRIGIVTIKDEDRVTTDCGLDSLALLETVLDLEDALGVTVPQDRMPALLELNFGQFAAFVRGRLEAKAVSS